MLAGKLRHHVLRKRAWTGNREIQVEYDVVDVVPEVVCRNVNFVQDTTRSLGSETGVAAQSSYPGNCVNFPWKDRRFAGS